MAAHTRSEDSGRHSDRLLRVEPAAVTAWDGRSTCVFHPAELDADTEKRARVLQLASSSPIWIDMKLAADPSLWLQPWDSTDADNVDWSAMEELSQLLRFALPAGNPRFRDPAVTALKQLPVLNELAVLRWLTEELATYGSASAVPLVGLIPVSTLRRRPDATGALDERLGFVLLRVNAAVVEDFVFTIRLPDRLCVGAGVGARTGRRVPADQHALQPPDLTIFGRYLPPGRSPQAQDVATALGIYLSATCGAAAEHARERLLGIESDLVELPVVSEGEQDAAALVGLCQNVFQTRGALQAAEEELVRVVQRQAEVTTEADNPLVATRKRYEHGLEELRCVQRDLRAIGEAMAARIASAQVHIVQHSEHRNRESQAQLQRLVGLLGTALVVPALVATLFSDSVRLPHPKPFTGLVAMLAVMVASAVTVWWLVNRRACRSTANASSRVPWPGAAWRRNHAIGRGRLGVSGHSDRSRWT